MTMPFVLQELNLIALTLGVLVAALMAFAVE